VNVAIKQMTKSHDFDILLNVRLHVNDNILLMTPIEEINIPGMSKTEVNGEYDD
jgi:hypothetical protein